MFYVEMVQNNVNRRGKFVELPDNTLNHSLDYFGKEVCDGFHSAFNHYHQIVDFIKDTGSFINYDGDVYTECLHWDIDNVSFDKSREDAIEVVETLLPFSPQNVMIYFSGNKGFHIIYYSPELKQLIASGKIDKKTLNTTVKHTCSLLATGVQSFDKRIYDKTRIIRTPNSKHGKTGLYKIPITYDELKDISKDDLIRLAKQQRKIDYAFDETIHDELTEIIIDRSNHKEELKENLYTSSELLDGIYNGFQSSNRNNGLTSLAGSLHHRGLDTEYIRAILHSVNKNNQPPLSASEVDTIVNSVSRYSTDSKELVKDSDIITFRDAGVAWTKNMKLSGNFTLGDRFPHINNVMSITLLGDLVGIVSNSGVGKSTLSMEFGNSLANIRNKYNLFVSLEMAKHAVFFRGATMSYNGDEHGNVSSKEVAYKLLHDQEVLEKVYKEWDRTLIVDKGSISLESLERYINIANEVCSGDLGCVAIDYAQYIDGASQIELSAKIAREVKEVMKRVNLIGFINFQCNKMIPDSYTEVQDSHVEGVKAHKQACDYMMAFWKDREDNKRLHGKFLKTRWEADNNYFDLVRHGLKYHSEDYKEPSPIDPITKFGGGL